MPSAGKRKKTLLVWACGRLNVWFCLFFFEKTVLWFCSYDAVDLGSDGSLTGDWYIHVENEFGCIWCCEPSPAESTDTAAERKLRPVSQCGPYCRYMAMRESIWQGGGGGIGWVLISWNNTFLLESLTQEVKILLVSSFKWYFSPRSMLSTGYMSWSLEKKTTTNVTVHSVIWMCCLSLQNYVVFLSLHVCSFTCSRIKRQENMHTGISLYYGSKSAARPSPANDIRTILCMSSYGKGGGVSMTWGYLLPLQHSLAIRATDKIRQKKKNKA